MGEKTHIPVLEIEKLTLTRDGRGIHVFNDGETFYSGGANTWTGVSGASNSLPFLLPAASATAWLRISFASSTAAGSGSGYIPLFKNPDITASWD